MSVFLRGYVQKTSEPDKLPFRFKGRTYVSSCIVSVRRTSGVEDDIDVLVEKDCSNLEDGSRVSCSGSLVNIKGKIYVLADSVDNDEDDFLDGNNRIDLTGIPVKYLKQKVTRRKNRKILNVMVDTGGGHIPCVLWGENAETTYTGVVHFSGRLQTRLTKEGRKITEVSVKTIKH